MKITHCKTCHMVNPVGQDFKTPVFTWTVEDARGKFMKDARIQIASDPSMNHIFADTGWKKDLDSLAVPVDLPLSPRTRYYWTVSLHTDADKTGTSEVQYFETAKQDEEWQAEWITCEDNEGRHPFFSRTFTASEFISSGRLYICGLGLYEAYLDGRRLSDTFLEPACCDYHAWLPYRTFELPAMNEGQHTLSVLLGNGWYKGRFGFGQPEPKPFGTHFLLKAELHLKSESSDTIIGTDTSWQVTYSHINFSSIYDGEHRDDTLPDTEPVPAMEPDETVRKELEQADLRPAIGAPIRIHETWAPKDIQYSPDGTLLLDLGQNFAGIFSLSVNEPKGTRVILQFGELLQKGKLFRDNLRTAKQEYIYISNGQPVILQPHFTYYGYRYVRITGLAHTGQCDFKAEALYSDLEETGQISTGSDDVNQLIHNTLWGMKSNFVGLPTDCPQRDERLGWTGDAQVFSPTASFFADTYQFYNRYMTDMNYEQKKKDGMVPNVIPEIGDQGTSSVWGDACTIIPWNMYKYYGDITILADHYEGMKAWLAYIQKIDGDDHGWERAFHWGDWLALDNPSRQSGQVFGGTDKGFIADVYYMYSAEITAASAGLLHKDEDLAYYQKLAQDLRQHVLDEYYSPNGRCCINTQTALLLTLEHHLSANLDLTRSMLRKLFYDQDDTLQTGFVGTPILCNVLSNNGMDDLAVKLLMYEGYPGWLYSVKKGATTIWERWDALDEDGTINASSMCSLNHYCYGSVTEWIWRHAAGIDPDSHGFRSVRFQPSINTSLHEAAAAYQSASGRYLIRWKIQDARHIQVQVEVPFGCTAQLILPHMKKDVPETSDNPVFADYRDGVCHLLPGKYTITYETEKPLFSRFSANSPIGLIKADPAAMAAASAILPSLGMLPDSLNDTPIGPFMLQFGAQIGVTEETINKLDQVLSEIE